MKKLILFCFLALFGGNSVFGQTDHGGGSHPPLSTPTQSFFQEDGIRVVFGVADVHQSKLAHYLEVKESLGNSPTDLLLNSQVSGILLLEQKLTENLTALLNINHTKLKPKEVVVLNKNLLLLSQLYEDFNNFLTKFYVYKTRTGKFVGTYAVDGKNIRTNPSGGMSAFDKIKLPAKDRMILGLD